MGYMKRGGSDHVPSSTKSPQFHRPSNYSFSLFLRAIVNQLKVEG